MSTKPRPLISVDRLYVARIIKDDATGTTYDRSQRLLGINTMGYNPDTQTASYPADGGVYDSYSSDGAATSTLRVADLSPSDYAMLMGVMRNESGRITEGNTDNPPEVAVGWRSEKSNGAFRFTWVLKGKFAKPQESLTSKGGSGITYSDQEIVHTSSLLSSNGERRNRFDSDDPLCPPGLTVAMLSDPETGFFSNPFYNPVAPGTPITITAATGGEGEIDITLPSTTTDAQAIMFDVEVLGMWIPAEVETIVAPGATSATLVGLTSGNTYKIRAVVVGGASNGISATVTGVAG